jgi:hypothetical protein
MKSHFSSDLWLSTAASYKLDDAALIPSKPKFDHLIK